MHHPSTAVLLSLALFLAGCGPKESSLPIGTSTHNLAAPVAEITVPKDRGMVKSDAEWRRMVKWLRSRYPQSAVRKTIMRGSKGFDCVDIDYQHGYYKPVVELAPKTMPIPPKVPPPSVGAVNVATVLGSRPRCEKGTVAKRKLTMDTLRRFKNLEEFGFKAAPPVTPGGGMPGHEYVRVNRSVANRGGEVKISIWKPALEDYWNDMSLSQIWVAGSSYTPRETVEAGWMVYPKRYGNDKPHFFIFSTNNNYQNFPSSDSAYDGEYGTFVFTGAGQAVIGEDLPHSTFQGTQYYMPLAWFKDGWDGAWWLWFNGSWLGKYEINRFENWGLEHDASHLAFGGEVYNSMYLGSRHSMVDMGSGLESHYGWGWSAWIQDPYIYFGSTTSPFDFGDSNNIWEVTRPYCYNKTDQSSNMVYYGGQGYYYGSQCAN